MAKENKLILYKDDKGKVSMNTRFADEDVWLTRENSVEIYTTVPLNISLHIGNIYQDWEISEEPTRKKSFQFANRVNVRYKERLTITISRDEAIEKAEREFEIYRENEKQMSESDFDKAVKRLKNMKDDSDKEGTC